jgi:hypothetical protein
MKFPTTKSPTTKFPTMTLSIGGVALAILGASAAAAPPSVADEPLPAVISIGHIPNDALPRPAGALTEAHFTTYELKVSGDRPDRQPITGATVVIDTSGAKHMAEFRFRRECKVVGDLATCPVKMPDGTGDPETTVPYLVRPSLSATAQDTGTITYRAQADNAAMADDPYPNEVPLTVADTTSPLELGGYPKTHSVHIPPGGRAAIPFTLTNIGATTVRRFSVTMEGFDGDDTLALPGNHKNCLYRIKDPRKPKSPRIGARCEFTTPAEPGKTYGASPDLMSELVQGATESRLRITVDSNPGPSPRPTLGRVWGTGAPAAMAPVPSSTVPEVPWPTDLYLGDNPGILGFTSDPVPDDATVGDTAVTQVGLDFPVEIGVANRGSSPISGAYVHVEIPAGVELIGHDQRCWKTTWTDRWNDGPEPTFGDLPGDDAPVPTGRLYQCGPSGALAAGTSWLVTLTLRATKELDHAQGVVFNPTWSPDAEAQRRNLAFLTITTRPDGTTG